MLGVDRLDMIKGIPQKILAFEKFLEENSHWRDKVVLLQIAVPTRTDVPECMISDTLDTVPFTVLLVMLLAF
jgi:trehalose-6-phosphate synthase